MANKNSKTILTQDSQLHVASAAIEPSPEDQLLIPWRSKSHLAVSEIYLDGKLKKAEDIDDRDKSYGIFMHSLILSNYAEMMNVNNPCCGITEQDYEHAISHYSASKGFNEQLIASIAPKVDAADLENGDHIGSTAHLINNNVRIVSKGSPNELLKRCSYILVDSRFEKITRKVKRNLNDVLLGMLDRCNAVYALAISDNAELYHVLGNYLHIQDMTLVALVGLGIL